MWTRLVLVVVLAAGSASAQLMGGTPLGGVHFGSTSTAPVGPAYSAPNYVPPSYSAPNSTAPPMSFLPPVSFGSTLQPGVTSGNILIFGTGVTRFPENAFPNQGNIIHILPPDRGYHFPYVYPERYNATTGGAPMARTPSIRALMPPMVPQGRVWDVIRTNYAFVAYRVLTLQQFIDDLAASLEEMNVKPNPDLVANLTNAQNALTAAREAMAAQDLERSRDEIRRAADFAAAGFTEFGYKPVAP